MAAGRYGAPHNVRRGRFRAVGRVVAGRRGLSRSRRDPAEVGIVRRRQCEARQVGDGRQAGEGWRLRSAPQDHRGDGAVRADGSFRDRPRGAGRASHGALRRPHPCGPRDERRKRLAGRWRVQDMGASDRLLAGRTFRHLGSEAPALGTATLGGAGRDAGRGGRRAGRFGARGRQARHRECPQELGARFQRARGGMDRL